MIVGEYGEEFEHAPDGILVLIAELRKILATGEPVTFTPTMIDFMLTQCEDVTYSFESMTAYCIEQGIISRSIANQWKAAYRQSKVK